MNNPMIDYSALDKAYTHFNTKLFDSTLPNVLITFRARTGTHGYFWGHRVVAKADGSGKTHEIALNLESSSRADLEVLSTLVHEMCHCWQEEYGTPPSSNYHNKEWAEKMLSVGLTPYNIKNPERMTGAGVTHNIDKEGLFEVVAQELLGDGWALNYTETQQHSETESQKKRRKQQRKIKYTCPHCEAKAWGKHNLKIACGDCSEFASQLILMETDNA